MLLGCQGRESADEAVAVKEYTIEQMMDNLGVNGGSFSHDGSKLLISCNKTGIYNAYEIPAAGGEMTPLTNSTGSSVFAISYFPEDDRILFSQDDNGNEISHIFLRDVDGSVRELTPGEKARASFYGWAHDRKSFFYGFTARDPRMTDIYEMDIETFDSKMIYQDDTGYGFGGISNDKQYMALVKPINTNDSELYLYRFSDGEMTKVSRNQAGYSPADFSVDSKSLYYLTDDGGEFNYLMRYDIGTGEHEKILADEWDIAYAYFSRNGKYRVVGVNADAKTEISITDMETGQEVEFPSFESGDITSVSISDDEELMRFYVGSSAYPSNLYLYNFEGGNYRELVNTLNPEIDRDDLVEAEVVRYQSFDGLDIPAIYYKPKQASPKNKAAALVWVHGGPGGQSRQSYSPTIQYLVNHGYAVLAVNNRGSSGYGKTFYKMDDQRHGEEDLKDCIWGKKWLAEQDYINAGQIGIIGGSYGGYMVMRAMTHAPEEFEVGVDIFGVTNWIRTLRSIPPWWESFKDALYTEMGNPYTEDSVRHYEISPLFHADKIANPVMVLQGAQDPRVLKVESDEIVEAAKANGVPVEYVVFDDEGHGFVKKENQIEAYGKILEFLDKYLKKEEDIKG
jgi:dipeptidyl aminopeptidase/acylaminoacyl peptidase